MRNVVKKKAGCQELLSHFKDASQLPIQRPIFKVSCCKIEDNSLLLGIFEPGKPDKL
jgi:hypothetical protein